MSCGCDQTVRGHFDAVLAGVYPTGNEVAGHGMVITNGPMFRP